MLLEDLIGDLLAPHSRELLTLEKRCTQFLKESASLPLYKLLPKSYGNFHRVKVRQQKHSDQFAETFNKALGKDFYNLRQRAVFASASKPEATSEEYEPFYVFPVNGYKYLYSKEVKNSTNDYKQVLDTLVEQFGNSEAFEIVTDVLKYTYTNKNLVEGIISESEIILYSIPYYYAIRVALRPSYGILLQDTAYK